MLEQYVQDFKIFDGTHLISFNVHHLIYLADKVIMQNRPLDDFGTWIFEIYNCSLKRFGKKK